MDRLSTQFRTPWLVLSSAPSHGDRAASSKELGHALRKFSIRSARLLLVAASLDSFSVRDAAAGCGCNERAEASCTACETCAETPRICGLGNGLLDFLDRASGRLESRLFRLRPIGSSCNCESGAACDVLGTEADSSVLTVTGDAVTGDQDTIIHHPSGPSHSNPESWQSPSTGSSGQIESSPVPVPIPDPIASPPMSSPMPAPAPRTGNPFTDEARSLRDLDDEGAPAKIVYSIRSSATSSLGSIKGDFAKVDVKPVPKHLLRGRSVDNALESHGVDRQMHAIQSEVVPAASLTPSSSSRNQFAR